MRPEYQAPPELFYDETEASKYTQNSRIIEIQRKLTERAIELLNLPEGKSALVLDVGCGSGLSGDVLTEHGHVWVGCDISKAMLDVASEREVAGDLMLHDAGQGFSFRTGVFDGCIGISVIQWLCNADKKTNVPIRRLTRFFQTLYTAMKRGGRAVFQFYPDSSQQMELITSSAMRAGFSGGLVVDYPHSTKAKKYYLCLFAGMAQKLPTALGAEESCVRGSVDVGGRETIRKRSIKKKQKDKNWVLEKKQRLREQGRDVRPDSKYTARKRRPKF
eukprot:Rmarinus@m.16899